MKDKTKSSIISYSIGAFIPIPFFIGYMMYKFGRVPTYYAIYSAIVIIFFIWSMVMIIKDVRKSK